MSTPNQQRELVFCHECENEWYRDQDGLQCPQCHSDFTEVIEENHDPRPGLSETRPLTGSNPPVDETWLPTPWLDLLDEDENVRQSDARSNNQRSMFGGTFYSSTAGPPTVGLQPGGAFASMMQSMLGPSSPLTISRQRPSDSGHFRPQSLPGSWPAAQAPRAISQSRNPLHLLFNGDAGFTAFTATIGTGPFGQHAGRGQGQDMGPVDIADIFGQLFGNIHGDGGAQNPLGALFNMLGNPANMQHGDAVYSQEAFDRVMSHFMEQVTTGNAPGPASQDAIAALPKRKVGKDMLDPNTGAAECSICMETIMEGNQVTMLPCSHWFDPECIESWLKEHDTCPVCRSGITPKNGTRDTARSPTQAPSNSLSELARRQSGTREHPFVVAGSPLRERRQPGLGRHSSYSTSPSSPRRHSTGGEEERNADNGGGGGIAGSVRRFFGGGSNGGASATGRH